MCPRDGNGVLPNQGEHHLGDDYKRLMCRSDWEQSVRPKRQGHQASVMVSLPSMKTARYFRKILMVVTQEGSHLAVPFIVLGGLIPWSVESVASFNPIAVMTEFA